MATALYAARNIVKTFVLLFGSVLAFSALGWWLGGVRLASVFFVVALLMAATVHWYGPRIVLASLGARELALGEAPLLHSTVERLAMTAASRGAEDLRPRGRPSSGALRRAWRERVRARREPGTRRSCDAGRARGRSSPTSWRTARYRDVIFQTPVVAARRVARRGQPDRRLPPAGAPLRPGSGRSEPRPLLLSPKREYAADALAARICETPHGLADALLRLEQAQELVEFQASPTTEPLYTVNPFAREGIATLFDTHPPIGERVRRLRALDPSWHEKLRAA